MGNNIIKISDLASKMSQNDNIQIATNSTTDKKEQFLKAKEIALKEIDSLSMVMSEFGKKLDERYAICDLIHLGKTLNEWFDDILETAIRPMVEGGEYISTNPNIDFKTMRYDFYEELSKVVERHNKDNN